MKTLVLNFTDRPVEDYSTCTPWTAGNNEYLEELTFGQGVCINSPCSVDGFNVLRQLLYRTNLGDASGCIAIGPYSEPGIVLNVTIWGGQGAKVTGFIAYVTNYIHSIRATFDQITTSPTTSPTVNRTK